MDLHFAVQSVEFAQEAVFLAHPLPLMRAPVIAQLQEVTCAVVQQVLCLVQPAK